MAFQQAGTFKGKVLETALTKPRFSKNPNAFDVCLKVQGPDGQSDWWRGEVSTEYGRGNFASKTQMQITLEALQRVGFQGNDFSQIDAQLLDKEIEFVVEPREHNNKTYYDVKYLGGGFGPGDAIDTNEMARRMAAMTQGSVPPAPAQAPAAVAPQPAMPAPAAQPATQMPLPPSQTLPVAPQAAPVATAPATQSW